MMVLDVVSEWILVYMDRLLTIPGLTARLGSIAPFHETTWSEKTRKVVSGNILVSRPSQTRIAARMNGLDPEMYTLPRTLTLCTHANFYSIRSLP